MLKKAASGVPWLCRNGLPGIVGILPFSRTMSTLRSSKGLRPCWTNFFEHSFSLLLVVYPGAFLSS